MQYTLQLPSLLISVDFRQLSKTKEIENQKWMQKLFQYFAASLWGRCGTPGRRGADFWQPLQSKTNFVIIFFLNINNLYTYVLEAAFKLVLDLSNLFRK